MGFFDGLLSGGLSLIGGLLGQDKTDERQAQAQAFNAAEAQKNRDFQERMSNTQYQRGMEDMREAGLNPILAYSKGGAGAPSGATASTSFTPANDVVTPAVNSALAAKRNTAEVENMVATNENLKATKDLLLAQSAESMSRTVNNQVTTKNIEVDNALKNAALHVALKDATRADSEKDFLATPAGRILTQFGLGGRMVGEGISPIGTVVNSAANVARIGFRGY